MHPFRAFISLYTAISDDDWETIQPCLKYKIIQQNRIILKQGEICNFLYFLENGSIDFYQKKLKENQIINRIQPPALFTAAHSFSTNLPSKFGIQATEESYIWVIAKEDAHKLLELSSWNNFLKNYFSNS